MAAINFPNSPTQGDTYTENDTIWEYDGAAWNVVSYNAIVTLSSASIDSLNDVDTTSVAPTDGQSLVWDNANSLWKPGTVSGGGSGEVNQNAFSNIAVTGQNTLQADIITDTLNIAAGAGISITTNSGTDTLTITSTGSSISFQELTDSSSANLTVDKVYEPAIVMLRVDNVGTSSYTFNSHYTGSNPNIYAISGTTIAFDLTAVPGHPFEIQSPIGDPYNTGLVHVATDGTVSTGEDAQGKDSGTLYWRIPETLNGNYRYQCQSHAPMVGPITIKRLSLI
jgi:plastocyanin